MKNHNVLVSVLIVACFTCLSSCFGPGPLPQKLRIKTFEWEKVIYRAEYDAYGTLLKLKAADRDITFLYDENAKLYQADILRHGQTIPDKHYTFSQGPWGITEIRTSDASYVDIVQPNYIHIMHYLTPTKLSSFDDQQLAPDEDGNPVISFELNRVFTYSGNNVALVTSIPPFTEYIGSSYDHKANPFMLLADAVNNPAFFPLGGFVNFMVVDYNIPLLSAFSKNNPLLGEYGTEGVPFPRTEHSFVYTYDGNLVKKIVWTNVFAGQTKETRVFKFEYEWARCKPRESHGHHGEY